MSNIATSTFTTPSAKQAADPVSLLPQGVDVFEAAGRLKFGRGIGGHFGDIFDKKTFFEYDLTDAPVEGLCAVVEGHMTRKILFNRGFVQAANKEVLATLLGMSVVQEKVGKEPDDEEIPPVLKVIANHYGVLPEVVEFFAGVAKAMNDVGHPDVKHVLDYVEYMKS